MYGCLVVDLCVLDWGCGFGILSVRGGFLDKLTIELPPLA